MLTAIVLLAGFLTAPLVSPPGGSSAALAVPALPARLATACVLFAAAGLYLGWSWSGGRRTLPMKTWRLALERADGRPVAAGNAVARYLAWWISPALVLAAFAVLEPAHLGRHALWLLAINYAWAFFDRDRQFLHDRIAGTRIVLDGTGTALRS